MVTPTGEVARREVLIFQPPTKNSGPPKEPLSKPGEDPERVPQE